MKILITVIIFFFAQRTIGQPIQRITSFLKEKDFISFKNFVDNHPKTNVDIYWVILRDIIPGYQEGIVKIVEYPLTGRDTDYTIYNYQIKFLTTDKNFFYYVFDKSYVKQGGEDDGKVFYSLVDSFNNTSEYNSFRKAFSEGYKAELDEMELFETSIVYGGACGIAGQPTEYQLKLDSLLKNKDLHTIRNWLKSPNSEKQLYAIQGLNALENSGDKLTPEDIRIIDLISKKNGLVKTCSGCIFSSDTIRNIVMELEEFRSDNYTSQNKSKDKGIIYVGLLITILLFSGVYFFNTRRTKKRGA